MSEQLWCVNEPVGICLKLDEEFDHQHCKEHKTASTTDLRNELGEVIELELKRSAFSITRSWGSGSAAFRTALCKELTHHDTAIKTLRTNGERKPERTEEVSEPRRASRRTSAATFSAAFQIRGDTNHPSGAATCMVVILGALQGVVGAYPSQGTGLGLRHTSKDKGGKPGPRR